MSDPKSKSPLEEFFNELTFKATMVFLLGVISMCMWSFSSSQAQFAGDFHALTEALLKVIRSESVQAAAVTRSPSATEAHLLRIMAERNQSLRKIEQALLNLPVDQPIVLYVPQEEMPDRPSLTVEPHDPRQK